MCSVFLQLCFFAHTPSQLRVTAKSAAAQQAASNNSGKKGGKGNKGATSSSNGSSSNLQQGINPAAASSDAQAVAGAAAASQDLVAAAAPAVSRLLEQLLADKASTTSTPSARLLQQLGQPGDDSLDEQTAAAIMLLLEQLEGEQCKGELGSSSMSPSAAASLQPQDPADSAAGGSSPRTPLAQPTTTAHCQLPGPPGFSATGKGRPCSWELSPGSSNASNVEQGPWAASSLWGQGSQDADQLLPTLSLSSAASINSAGASAVLPAAAAAGSKSCQPLQLPCLVSPDAVPHSSSSSGMKLQGGLLQGPIPVELLSPGLQGMAGSAPAYRVASELFSGPGAHMGSSGFTAAAAAGLVQGQQGVIDLRQLSGGVLSGGMGPSQSGQLPRGSSCLEFPSATTLDNLTASLSTSNLNSLTGSSSSNLLGSLVSLASPVGVSSSSSVLGPQVAPTLLNQLATQQQVQVQQRATAAVLGGFSNTMGSVPGSEALAMGYGSPMLPGYGNQAYSAAAAAAAAQQQELQLSQQQAALLLQQQMQCQAAARPVRATLAGPSPLIGMAGGELGLPASLLQSADMAVIAQQLQQCQTESGVSEIGFGGRGTWVQQDRGVMGMLLQGNAGPWCGAHTQVSPCLVGLSV